MQESPQSPNKDIEPTVDALDEHLRVHGSKQIRSERNRIIRCVNRMVNPHKQHDKTHIYDSWGCIIAKKCYASKRWCPFEGPKAVKFGVRKKHKSGFNKMTVKARKVWEANQAIYDETLKRLDFQLTNKEITNKKYVELKAEAIGVRYAPFDEWDEGFSSMQECMNYLKEHGLLV